MSYCIANATILGKWCQNYVSIEIKNATLPALPMQTWLLEAMKTAKDGGAIVSSKEMDYAYGYDWQVSVSEC